MAPTQNLASHGTALEIGSDLVAGVPVHHGAFSDNGMPALDQGIVVSDIDSIPDLPDTYTISDVPCTVKDDLVDLGSVYDVPEVVSAQENLEREPSHYVAEEEAAQELIESDTAGCCGQESIHYNGLLHGDEDVLFNSGGELYDADIESEDDGAMVSEGTQGEPTVGGQGVEGQPAHGSQLSGSGSDLAGELNVNSPPQPTTSISSVTADSLSELDDQESVQRPPFRRSKRIRQGPRIMDYERLGEPRIKRYPFLFQLEAMPARSTSKWTL